MTNAKVVEPDKTPKDTISDLVAIDTRGLPIMFAASSWDNSIYVYGLNPDTLEVVLLAKGTDPEKDAILKIAFEIAPDNKQTQKLFYGTARGNIKCFTLPQITPNDCMTGKLQTMTNPTLIGEVKGVIVGLRYSKLAKRLISVSTDKVCVFWDPSKPKAPTQVLTLTDNPTCMDVFEESCTIGFASDKNKFGRIDVKNPTKIDFIANIPFDSVPTDISCGPNSKSFVVGGSTSQFLYSDEKGAIPFLAHNDEARLMSYGINSVKVSPLMPYGISGGGDGTVCYFNLKSGKKINQKPMNSNPNVKLPVTSVCFVNLNGKPQFIVAACGYDWAKGYEEYVKGNTVEIHIKRIIAADFG